jgi:hypothetical protein
MTGSQEWRTSLARDLGDFQTPEPLVACILDYLCATGIHWDRVLEPTCGSGNFIKGLLSQDTPPREIQALELQDAYVEQARTLAETAGATRLTVHSGNIFDTDLVREFEWTECGPLLVVGNPPWVTNSELGSLGSKNLPDKRNLKGVTGIDALTGSSNFDIAEYIWIKLVTELAEQRPTIALLCKTSVARNLLKFSSDTGLPIADAVIRRIDAKRWFGAAVDACLFHVTIGQSAAGYEATVYEDLEGSTPESVCGVVNGNLVVDVPGYTEVAFVDGICPLTWRQGLKHDAASVMELTTDNSGHLVNKLGGHVRVECSHIYPLLKSSDLANKAAVSPQRSVVVPHRALGDDTRLLAHTAPELWRYLSAHADAFERRKSSIYRGKPPFSIFGIGDYSFAPYKVAVSGLHKDPVFRAVGPVGEQPVMFDDTCYLVPCQTAEEAALLVALLDSPLCRKFIQAVTFRDSKRPVTKKLLQRIDLASLLDHVDWSRVVLDAHRELRSLVPLLDVSTEQWHSVRSGILAGGSATTTGNGQMSFLP